MHPTSPSQCLLVFRSHILLAFTSVNHCRLSLLYFSLKKWKLLGIVIHNVMWWDKPWCSATLLFQHRKQNQTNQLFWKPSRAAVQVLVSVCAWNPHTLSSNVSFPTLLHNLFLSVLPLLYYRRVWTRLKSLTCPWTRLKLSRWCHLTRGELSLMGNGVC